MNNMNWIKHNRIANKLTQIDLSIMVNYELSNMNSEHSVSQSRISNLERLDRLGLLSSLYTIEYKAMKRIFSELNEVNTIGGVQKSSFNPQ